jgi:hypothetical protein
VTAGQGVGFWLRWIEPADDPRWQAAPTRTKKAFWNQAARWTKDVWITATLDGRDRFGKRMPELDRWTRQARRDNVNPVTGMEPYTHYGVASEWNPPLQPGGFASPTTRFFTWVTTEEGVWFFWKRGMGDILAKHAEGFRVLFVYPKRIWIQVPARDVLGISRAQLAVIERKMAKWWEERRKKLRAPGEVEERPTIPIREDLEREEEEEAQPAAVIEELVSPYPDTIPMPAARVMTPITNPLSVTTWDGKPYEPPPASVMTWGVGGYVTKFKPPPTVMLPIRRAAGGR